MTIPTHKTKSKLRFFGGFGLVIAMMLLLSFLAFILIKEQLTLFNDQNSKLILVTTIVIAWLFALAFLGGQSKIVTVYTDRITYTNLLFPFIQKTRFFHDYDYCITVTESSQAGNFDVLWLIKNNKLKDRISSLYYSNYDQLEHSIKIIHKGKNKMGMFKQLRSLLGCAIENKSK